MRSYFFVIFSHVIGYIRREVVIHRKIWYSNDLCWIKLPISGGGNNGNT